MKVAAKANPTMETALILVPESESQKLYKRKILASKLVAECKHYISNKTISNELRGRITALKDQDSSLTTTEAIVILLDYAEREFREIESLEKGNIDFMEKVKNAFHNFTNIFE